MARGIEAKDREHNQSHAETLQLALEIRSQRFAFAVLHGADLLDWGARNVPRGPSSLKLGIRKLVFLLDLYAPTVVVARRTPSVRGAPAKRAARVFARIRDELKRRSIRFIVLDRGEVRSVFAKSGYRTKQEIAAAVAEQFEALKPRLPRPRKPWDPERKRLAIFDALATALASTALRKSEYL